MKGLGGMYGREVDEKRRGKEGMDEKWVDGRRVDKGGMVGGDGEKYQHEFVVCVTVVRFVFNCQKLYLNGNLTYNTFINFQTNKNFKLKT